MCMHTQMLCEQMKTGVCTDTFMAISYIFTLEVITQIIHSNICIANPHMTRQKIFKFAVSVLLIGDFSCVLSLQIYIHRSLFCHFYCAITFVGFHFSFFYMCIYFFILISTEIQIYMHMNEESTVCEILYEKGLYTKHRNKSAIKRKHP